nr:uncharacterized protein LOC100179320 [Ciona intestinalis]|eukprot:XP_002124715.3 uncharacterized protein LOC100179320 [Ciona intestinalis]
MDEPECCDRELLLLDWPEQTESVVTMETPSLEDGCTNAVPEAEKQFQDNEKEDAISTPCLKTGEPLTVEYNELPLSIFENDDLSIHESIAESLYGGRPFNETTTLLEKAAYFRERYPGRFSAQQDKLQREYIASLGIFEPDPVLEEYYEIERVKRILKQERLKNEKRGPPKMVFILRFDTPASTPDFHALWDSVEESDYVSIFENEDESIFDVFRSNKCENSSTIFTVTVKKGKNLLKMVNQKSAEERLTRAKVKLVRYCEVEKKTEVAKSSYRYVNTNGKSRWGHKFVFMGFSKEQLSKLRLTFNVKGKNDENTAQLCKVSVACRPNGDTPAGFKNVSKEWETALKSPGQDIEFEQNLDKPDGMLNSSGFLNTITNLLT